jgi:hypothetical protein
MVRINAYVTKCRQNDHEAMASNVVATNILLGFLRGRDLPRLPHLAIVFCLG